MATENETIADIIAEKRRRADEIERDCAEKMKRGEMTSDQYARELVAYIRKEADRLEAAHKRERGDCAKLREAVKAVVDVGYPHNFQREAPHIRGYCYDITRAIDKCFAALSTPPRNCDRFATVKDAAIAFARERQDAPHPCPDFTFSAWLFAPATKQKGEN